MTTFTPYTGVDRRMPTPLATMLEFQCPELHSVIMTPFGETQDEEEDRKNPRYNDFYTDVMEKDGLIGVAINCCFGGFSFSEDFKTALAARGVVTESYWIRRNNKVLIEMLDEAKIDPNTYGSNIQIEWIEKKYFEGPGFWKISEYDGSEGVEVDERAYDLWRKGQIYEALFKEGLGILNDEQMTNGEKILALKKLFSNV